MSYSKGLRNNLMSKRKNKNRVKKIYLFHNIIIFSNLIWSQDIYKFNRILTENFFFKIKNLFYLKLSICHINLNHFYLNLNP